MQLRRVTVGEDDRVTVVAVASELRDNPRGLGLTTDVPGWAAAVLDHLAPRSVRPERVQWFVRHGWYSTYDPAGRETLTALKLAWDGRRFVDDVARHRLVPDAQARALAARWRLEPVDIALAALGQPAPRRSRLEDQDDLFAPERRAGEKPSSGGPPATSEIDR